MSCEGCPNLSSMRRRLEWIAGAACLKAELNDPGTQLEVFVNGVEQTIQSRITRLTVDEAASLVTNNPLPRYPVTQIDVDPIEVSATKQAINRLESHCSGYRQSHRYILFGRKIVRCRSRALSTRINGPDIRNI